MAIECDKCGASLPVHGRQWHVCDRKYVSGPRPVDPEFSEAVQRCQFSMRNGFASWTEWKAFIEAWSEYKSGKGTKQQLDEWIEEFNSRFERQEFRV